MILKKIERKIDYYIKRITEYPLLELSDQITVHNDNYIIPPTVYQTWENNLFGKTHYKQILKFRKINSDLTFKLFDKEKRNDYMKTNWSHHPIYNVYNKSNLGVMKADIFRYCILYDKGGYYFDISKGCKIPLRTLHDKDTEALLSFEPVENIIPPSTSNFKKLKYPHNNFLQWGFGFKKNHIINKKIINAIVDDHIFYKDKKFENPKLAVLSLTGTGQFTKIVRQHLSEIEDDKLIQSGIYFNGYGIFSMKGCRVRHHLVPSYADLKNTKII